MLAGLQGSGKTFGAGRFDISDLFEDQGLPRSIRIEAEGYEVGNIDVVREFMDVRKVCEVYRRLLACEAAVGDTVNICSGRGMRLREVIELLEMQTSHRMEIRVNPRFIRAGEVRRLIGSPHKLEALIGPVAHAPLVATLRAMLEEA